MEYEPGEPSPNFRFGLRSLLAVVTGLCFLAGMFWYVSLVLLLLAGVLLFQCLFFLVIQRLVILIAGSPSAAKPASDSQEASQS